MKRFKINSLQKAIDKGKIIVTNRPTPRISDEARELMKRQDEAKNAMYAEMCHRPFPSVKNIKI